MRIEVKRFKMRRDLLGQTQDGSKGLEQFIIMWTSMTSNVIYELSLKGHYNKYRQ